MPLPIIINGALGKMGIEIAGLALDDQGLEVRAAADRAGHPRTGEDYGLCIGRGKLGIPVADRIDDDLLESGVVIDFSSPQSSAALLRKACTKKMRLVVGTTGLSSDDLAVAAQASTTSAVLVSPNMGLGVNLLFLLTEFVASKLKDDFDIEIIEAHHRFKKDSPSGTARRLGEIAAKAHGLSYDEAVKNGRAGIIPGERPRGEVGMHAVRGGDIVGDHTVLFAGMGERIELRHMMHSRATLARGALRAAKWIAEQTPGLYSMRDVLGM